MYYTSAITGLVYQVVILIIGKQQVLCYTASNKFLNLLGDATFVDKSLLIKEIINNKDVKNKQYTLITAPKSFGKTTNLDMLKAFLSINVDEDGKTITSIEQTGNYNVFKGLAISDDDSIIFEENFNKHLVIHVDFSPLNEMRDFESLLQQFRVVLRNTFSQHKYLAKNKTLWVTNSDRNLFMRYCENGSKVLTEEEVENGFSFLAESLVGHFQKNIYLLVDEYDAAIYRFMTFGEIMEIDDIFGLIQRVGNNLYQASRQYMEKVLLTGTLQVTEDVLSLPSKDDVKIFTFGRNHNFSQFYGVTKTELGQVLIQRFVNFEERQTVSDVIEQYFKGYKMLGMDEEVYCTGVVMDYLKSKTMKNPWKGFEYLENLNHIFQARIIMDDIGKLLHNQGLAIKIPGELSDFDIKLLSEMHANKFVSHSKTFIQQFYGLLFELGFFTFDDRANHEYVGRCTVRIPNEDIKLGFVKLLRDYFVKSMNIYNKQENCLADYMNTLDDITVYNRTSFQKFLKSVYTFTAHTNFAPKNQFEFPISIYAELRSKFPRCQTRLYSSKARIYPHVWAINDHGVIFIYGTKITQVIEKDIRETYATGTVIDVMRKGRFSSTALQSKTVVYVGICLERLKKFVSIVHSKSPKGNRSVTPVEVFNFEYKPSYIQNLRNQKEGLSILEVVMSKKKSLKPYQSYYARRET